LCLTLEQIALFVLMLTQIGLGLELFYQRYIQRLDTAYTRDISLIIAFSVFSYWGARLYFGALLPVLSFKRLLLAYIALVLLSPSPPP